MSKIIAVNAGSSSLKFQLFNYPGYDVIVSGVVERIGLEMGTVTLKYDGKKDVVNTPFPTHTEAVDYVLKSLLEKNIISSLDEIKGCGHRVVQGGSYFSSSAICDEDSIAKVQELAPLAPLHNPANLTGYYAFKKAIPDAGQIFVFDTAFHQTMKPENYLYALPYEYYTDLKVRRYGAHGTSHKYVSQQAIEMLGNPEHSKVVVCHLGNGASLSAVKDGKCMDTSMGFTPLAGVVMGTRCGDVDPSIMPYLCEKLEKTPAEVLDIYNKKSGMLGVSGVSSDSRDVEAAYNEGNERAIVTFKLYARTVAKFIGSYFVELGGVDAIAFTAGIGENSAITREMICDELTEALGVEIDKAENNTRKDGNRVISTADSKVKVMIIPTNEELMIAKDVVDLLGITE